MSEKQEKDFVPKLRFPEFRELENWQPRKLSEILFEHLEKSTGKEEVFSVSVHKGVVNQIEHLGRKFSAENTDHYKRVLPGDIVYTKSPTGDFPFGIIKQSKVSYPIIVSPLYGVFSPETKAIGYILDSYFERPEATNNYLGSLVQKGAKNTISIANDRFLSKSLVLPIDKGEQQKIADCLSSLDELIEAHTQKLDALKDHKKGLLQQLFPREGEKVPRLRFPGFEKIEEWIIEPFWKVYGFGVTNSFTREDLTFEKGSVKNIHYGDIHTKFPAYFDVNVVKVPFVKNSVSLKKIKSSSFCKEGDMIFADASEDKVDIGKSIEIVNLSHSLLLSGLHTILARQLESKIIVGLGAYLFQSPWIRKQIQREAQGAKVLGISPKRLEKITIYYPKSKIEQKNILDAFVELDGIIVSQDEKINALKEHKRGLLQGFFP